MPAKSFQLLRYCKTDEGWKRLPAAFGSNGRIKPGFAILSGLAVKLPGHYTLRTTTFGKTSWTNEGNDAARAIAARDRLEHLHKATQAAEQAGVKIGALEEGRLHLKTKKEAFLARLQARGKTRAIVTSGQAIQEFLDISMITYADQLKEDTILKWYSELRRQGNEDRTIYNKHVALFGFLRWLRIDTKALAECPPSYTERAVTIYRQNEINVLFDSFKRPYLKIVFVTMLQTGLRERELVHLDWANVDLGARRINVREHTTEKGKIGIKDAGERSVPFSLDLASKLEHWKQESGGTDLVFPTKNGRPNGKLLQTLKRAARQAGLNCGKCPGCRGHGQECSKWTLKRFRATCTTTLLRNGIDVRTVMAIVGHQDLATTMKYLAVAEESSTLAKLDLIAWS